jgi:hypothetical protein
MSMLLATPVVALPPPLTCLQLDGLPVYSAPPERRYLGFLGSAAARDSVFNSSGPYGSRVGGEGIQNRFSSYGSALSAQGVRSLFATDPPGLPPFKPVSANPLRPSAVTLNELAACRFTALAVRADRGDADGDGVPDERDAFPSNPDEIRDTDRDGIGDREDRDDDNDGLGDSEEEWRGTDARIADSDGDGYGDGDEVAWESDPLNASSAPIDVGASRLLILLRAILDREKQ